MKLLFEVTDEQKPILAGEFKKEIVNGLRNFPLDIFDALRTVLLVKDTSDKIKNNFYEDKVTILIAQPKSGSSALGNIVSEIFKQKGYAGRSYPQYMIQNVDMNLRPEILLSKSNGGVIKAHPAPSACNIKFLSDYKLKYILNFRHPADQLVSLACHYRDPNNQSLSDQVMPFIKNQFESFGVIQEQIQYLIKNGNLLAQILWCADWLALRNAAFSKIYTYEGLMENFKKSVAELQTFYYPNEKPIETDIFVKEYEKGKNIQNNPFIIRGNNQEFSYSNDSIKYPHGYSGEIGICKKYFDTKTTQLYNKEIEKILNLSHAGLSEYQKIYKDLKL